MARPPAFLLALGLGVAALGLAACGGEDAQLLPGQTAREITANLDTVKRLSDEGDCLGAESAAQQVSEQVEELGGVDRKLKLALREGAERLNEVIAGCEEATTEAIAPAEVPAETEGEEKPSKAEEKEAQAREKAEKKGAEPEETTSSPPLPPQAEGEGKGPEEGSGPPVEEAPEETPSGGVSPGSPAEGE